LDSWRKYITARPRLTGFGIQTAAVAVGGGAGPAPAGIIAGAEEYDGSAWTAGGSLGTGRRSLAGAGIQTAGLAFAGTSAVPTVLSTATEEYDGSTWTAGGALNTARFLLSRCRNSNSCFRFWWLHYSCYSSNRRI
jgi:hypothetical protein